ncbi:hypothetical protein Tco_0941264 [Tanacetum coccineum]|uniref:Uncharacterized protein n=1 Tax=Tanacetum coccineum TaxID=301880 RepID=A0ABQ5DWC8_9ASTR
MNDDTPMCERHEANYIQSGGYQNQNSHDWYTLQPQSDRPQSNNDSEKSLTELVNGVKNGLEYFKSYIRSKRTDYDNLHDENFYKPTGVLPNKKSKTVNQEPQSKTELKKLITKFLDGQRVTNMFVKNNWKAKLKEETDARSDVCLLSNGSRESSDANNEYHWVGSEVYKRSITVMGRSIKGYRVLIRVTGNASLPAFFVPDLVYLNTVRSRSESLGIAIWIAKFHGSVEEEEK